MDRSPSTPASAPESDQPAPGGATPVPESPALVGATGDPGIEPPGGGAPGAEAPRRRGRRARRLTPEEEAEQERRAAVLLPGPAAGTERSAPHAAGADVGPVPVDTAPGRSTASVDAPGAESVEETDRVPAADHDRADGAEPEHGPELPAPHLEESSPGAEPEGSAGAALPTPPGSPAPHPLPEKEATPAVRRLGRRARVVEVEEPPAGLDPARPGVILPPDDEAAAKDRDADGVQLGEMSVTEAPDPRPAPRFEGRVLHRPDRSGGNSTVWIVWGVVALALILLVILLLTGVLGAGASSAAAAAAVVVPGTRRRRLAHPAPSMTHQSMVPQSTAPQNTAQQSAGQQNLIPQSPDGKAENA